MKKNNLLDSKKIGFTYDTEDITLKDDAFHDSKSLMFTEWWYFDTVLSDGYAAQMNVRVASAFKKSIFLVYLRLELFKDGQRIFHNKKIFSKKKFFASKDEPLVKIGEKEVIKGTIDKKTGNWIFDVSVGLDDASANLRFEGITKGFKGRSGIPRGRKGKTKEGGWAVIIPRAKVSGKIKVKNEEIEVNGFGYHDHNWDMKLPVLTNYGWLWGKIYFDDITVVWAKVFETKDIASPICLISLDNNGYINVKPEDIKLVASDFRKIKGKMLPHFLNLNAINKQVSLNIDMDVLETDYESVMGLLNYFRFHTKCSGSIKIDNKEERVDGRFIAEFLRFG